MNVPCTFQSSTPIEAVFLSCSSETTDVRCSFIPERLPHPDTQTPQTSFSPVLTIWLKRDLSIPWTKLHLSVKDARGRLLTTTSLSLVSIQSASTQERSLFNTLSTSPTPGILGPFRFNVLDNDTYILEPGESVTLRPEWLNTKSTDISSLTGTVSQFTSSVSGTTYTITDASASYGTIPRASSKNCEPDCYGVSIGVEPSDRPVHWDATILESLSNGTSRTWTIHIGKSFTDVPPQPAAPESQPSAREKWEKYRAVEIFIHKGFTSGCGGRNFCPNTILTRGMMAYFIGKARESTGSVYPTTGYLSHMTTTELNGRSEKYVCETNGSVYFDDVSPTGAFCPYIHGLFAQDVIDACDASPTSFCGSDQVTREEFALTLARAVAYGQDMIPRVVSSGPRTYNCTDGQANHFTDVPDTDELTCSAIHYLWSKGVFKDGDDEFANGYFYPTAPINRAQAALFIVRAFGFAVYHNQKVSDFQRAWEWGVYDLLHTSDASTIENITQSMRNKGMDGVRFFLNTDFRENPTDLLPMTYSITQDPQTGQNKYDLCSRNPGFWKRFRSAINAMHAQGYHKILFTMSHNYNGGACTYCPWGYNTQNWTSANGNWMNSWSNLASEQPPSCNIPGVTNARDWIIHEYIELTRRMYLYVGRTLTIEIHNEPAHSGANLSEIQQAHIDLINALRSEFPDLNIQVNLDPIEGLNSTTHCPDIDAGSLSTMWNALSSMVDVWALHTFIPDCVDPSLNVYPSGSLFWTMFESGKLEISADGQFCSNQGGDIHLKCQCCHILTGETLDMALRQSKNRGYAQKFAPFSFEHSWGGETLAGHTASAHRNYDDWDVWENDEIACLRQRADAGDLNQCGGGALAPRSSVIKHILGNGNFNDGSCLIVPYAQRNNTIFLLWNSTFSTAGHEYTCSLTGDNLNSPGDDIVGLASTTLDCSSGSCSATYTLTCGGGIPTQNLQVSVCGDNACTKMPVKTLPTAIPIADVILTIIVKEAIVMKMRIIVSIARDRILSLTIRMETQTIIML